MKAAERKRAIKVDELAHWKRGIELYEQEDSLV